ncbi:unnamed protein product, partial [Musa acuminata subsp. burmannicoides]
SDSSPPPLGSRGERTKAVAVAVAEAWEVAPSSRCWRSSRRRSTRCRGPPSPSPESEISSVDVLCTWWTICHYK